MHMVKSPFSISEGGFRPFSTLSGLSHKEGGEGEAGNACLL